MAKIDKKIVKHVALAKIYKFSQNCKNLINTVKIFQNCEMSKLQNYKFFKFCQNYEILLTCDNFFKN